MKKHLILKCLLFLFPIILSCVEMNSNDKEIDTSEKQSSTKSDTLKFGAGISVIFQDSKGNYWFGIHNGGAFKYNGKTAEYFTTNEGLLNNQIRSIQEDKNGNILISTARGLSIYNGKKFTNHSTNTKEPIVDWNETNGDFWFYAGEEEGINRFDGKNINYLIFPKPKNQDPYNTYGVTDISEAKDGKVWIATYAALFNYDGKKVNIFEHDNIKLKENDLLHIRGVLADSKGRIWIGNNGIGVLLIEGETTINFSEKHHLIHPTSTRRGDKSKPGTLEHVFAIEEDSEGNIWFGDRDSGAWKYDGKTMTNYTKKDGLTNDFVQCIYKDKNDVLWLGLADGNVFKFNGKTFEKQF